MGMGLGLGMSQIHLGMPKGPEGSGEGFPKFPGILCPQFFPLNLAFPGFFWEGFLRLCCSQGFPKNPHGIPSKSTRNSRKSKLDPKENPPGIPQNPHPVPQIRGNFAGILQEL